MPEPGHRRVRGEVLTSLHEKACSWVTTSILVGAGPVTTSSSTRPRTLRNQTDNIAAYIVSRILIRDGRP
eukprot:2785324-Pyramimonas_sp.AAC.1